MLCRVLTLPLNRVTCSSIAISINGAATKISSIATNASSTAICSRSALTNHQWHSKEQLACHYYSFAALLLPLMATSGALNDGLPRNDHQAIEHDYVQPEPHYVAPTTRPCTSPQKAYRQQNSPLVNGTLLPWVPAPLSYLLDELLMTMERAVSYAIGRTPLVRPGSLTCTY